MQISDLSNPTRNNNLQSAVSDDHASVGSQSVTNISGYDAASESGSDNYPKRNKDHRLKFRLPMEKVSEHSRSSDEVSSTTSGFRSGSIQMQRTNKIYRQPNPTHSNYSSNPSLSNSYASIRFPNSFNDDQRSIDYMSDANSTKNNYGSDTESRHPSNGEVNSEVFSASDMIRTQACGKSVSMRNTSIPSQTQPLSMMLESETSLQGSHRYTIPASINLT